MSVPPRDGPLSRSIPATLSRVADTVAYAAALLSAMVLSAMVALVFVNVVLRNTGYGSIDYTTEVVGYGVAAITWGGLAWAMREGALIRVSLLGSFLKKHPRLDGIFYVATLLLVLFSIVYAAIYFLKSVLRQWARGVVSSTTAEIPIWMPEAVMTLGLSLMALQVSIMIICRLQGCRKGSGDTLGEAAATSSSKEI